MARINRLERDTNRVANSLREALINLGAIGGRIDDRDLRAAGVLIDEAAETLRQASARFRRKGTDYPVDFDSELIKSLRALMGRPVCAECHGRIDRDEQGRFCWVPSQPTLGRRRVADDATCCG